MGCWAGSALIFLLRRGQTLALGLSLDLDLSRVRGKGLDQSLHLQSGARLATAA